MTGPESLKCALRDANVTWQTVGELGELLRGNGLQKKDFVEEGVPAIHYGQIYTYYGLSTKTTKSFVSAELAKTLRKVDKGDVVITNTSENIEDVGKALCYLGDEQAVTGGHATVFKPGNNIIGKYFAYYTQTAVFGDYKRKFAKGAKVIDVSATDLAKIPVPIPYPDAPEKSLAIQAEIVRFLDTFSALTAELSKELSVELKARVKQCNFYRDQLLTFPANNTEWMQLSDIADIGTGSRNTNEAVVGGKYPFYVRSQEPRRIDQFEFNETAIITAGDGVGVGKVFHFVNGQYALHQRAYRIAIKNERVNPKFVFHFMRHDFGDYLRKISVHASVTSLRRPMFEKYPIPIPHLSEQDRIVSILDKLDTVTSSLERGLPREIELRQKQFAYYRDLLFSFPKPDQRAVEHG